MSRGARIGNWASGSWEEAAYGPKPIEDLHKLLDMKLKDFLGQEIWQKGEIRSACHRGKFEYVGDVMKIGLNESGIFHPDLYMDNDLWEEGNPYREDIIRSFCSRNFDTDVKKKKDCFPNWTRPKT